MNVAATPCYAQRASSIACLILHRDAQLAQPGHQLFLRPVALHPVAMGAQQLQVLDVVLATGALRNNVVYLEDAERELAAASVAPALLLAEQDMLVLAVGYQGLDIGAPGDVVRAVTSRLWNRSAMDCCRRILTSSTALGEMSMPV